MRGLSNEALFDAGAALLLKLPQEELIGQAAAALEFAAGPGELALAREDWNELFFVPSSGRYLPPLESAFREKRLGGPHAADALAAYRAAGFDPARLDVDQLWRPAPPPDHLGVELAFVSALIGSASRRPETAEGLLASAALFHAAHVAPWAGDYGMELERKARSETFRALGRLFGNLAAWTPDPSAS
ncbi:molecular chaperone TorD family protein [Fundidesulfovibrio terrae]|uniref:molecular chaperone TorD family protein n=1 Tax=Fundidesulfovibrio terrae TaxID=2922866 RepID=UPI001FB0077D|nr:molecular chaperone TorD family protein [Fundidesulfovibrio terrae]